MELFDSDYNSVKIKWQTDRKKWGFCQELTTERCVAVYLKMLSVFLLSPALLQEVGPVVPVALSERREPRENRDSRVTVIMSG